MFILSTNEDNAPVNIDNVDYFIKQGTHAFNIAFYFQRDCTSWSFDTEEERNKNYNLIKNKFGVRLDEWN